MTKLVEKLKDIQHHENLNDGEFARKLGISAVMWRSAKKGRKNLGDKSIGGILVALPGLRQDILEYLRRKNGD